MRKAPCRSNTCCMELKAPINSVIPLKLFKEHFRYNRHVFRGGCSLAVVVVARIIKALY